ncbi:MAG: alpha/beta fold hydrolase [Pseudomonadota bacterium]
MQILLRTLFWAVTLYCLYCALLFVLQRRLMYPANLVEPLEIPSGIAGKIEKSWLTTDQGKTETWFLPPAAGAGNGRAPAILFAHGNAELIDGLPDEFDWLTEDGFALLFVEYPGYGRSQGHPTQQNIMETLLAAYDMLVQRPDVNPDKIILCGRSLGGGTISTIADKRPSAGMILISTFTDTRSFAVNYLAPGFLVRDSYDTISILKAYPNPVLIVHGRYDDVVPYSHAVKLAAATKRATLITYASGHIDCPPDDLQFRQDLLPFFHTLGIILHNPTPRVRKTM